MIIHEYVDVSVPWDEVIVKEVPFEIAEILGIPCVPPAAVHESRIVSPVATAVVFTVTVPPESTAPVPEHALEPCLILRVLPAVSIVRFPVAVETLPLRSHEIALDGVAVFPAVPEAA